VPPLTVPDLQIAVSKEDVAESAAVRLFVERARAVVPTFTLSDANARAIASICHRLDGLPLAIELAATQIGILPPAALLNRIAAHLPLPVAGPRDAPDRHRTVRNAIAWSYDLLHTHEQRLFRYVGVFAGGFGIDAAEYLELAARDTALGDTSPARDVLNGLASLVDKSLLQQVAWQGDARFAMLETIRGFALDQMEASGEREAVGDAHADWCLELAERTRFAAITPGGEAQLVRIEMEHANIRAALEWLEQRGDVVRLLRLVTALREFWYENNHYREGRMWLERALVTATGAPDIERARALTQLGHLLSLQGDTTRAQTLLDQGLAALRNEEEMTEVALALVWRGAIANHLGTYEQAERYLQEALGMATSLPDPRIAASMTARALANLGIAAHGRGDLDEAIKRHDHALRICREHGYVLGVVRSLRDLGDVARDRGDSAGSLAYYRESLSLLGEQSDLRVVFDVLEGTALAAARWNRSEDAARLLGAAEALRDHLGTPVAVEPDRVAHQRAIAAISATLEAQGFDKAWSRGRRMGLSEAIAEVLAMSPPPIPERQASHSAMRLSRREIEVLELLVAGHSDREIAEALSLSVRTVEGHVTHIREKLGVQTRTAAVAFAITTGLIDPASLSRD
jgi:non-specific serine/threonine protein kinase